MQGTINPRIAVSGRVKILGVAIHTIDHFADIPLWKYSMAFLYLKAYLAKFPESQGTIFDMRNYYQNESVDSIVADIVEGAPDVVLFSVYVWNYLMYTELSRRIKELSPNVLIVAGGPEVAGETRMLLAGNPAFDLIVRGEGEHPFYEIVKALIEARDFATIRGITFRRKDEIIETPNPDPSFMMGLEMIPSIFTPAVFDWVSLEGSFVALETQRGCNFSCGFCRYRKIGEGARFFPLSRVLGELDFIRTLNCKHLYLMDPTFNNDLNRAKTILQHIIDLDMNLQINAEMIPELMDEELLELALRAGMVNLEIGIQAVKKPVLRIMQRPRNDRKLQEKTLIACNKEIDGKKLNVIPQIIFGLPGDTFETYCESFNYLYDLDVDEIAAYHLLILRDTQFFFDREKYDLIYDADPPHRLISNYTWPADKVLLAGKLSCLAMSTQYTLRGHIRAYCAWKGISASDFFLLNVEISEQPDILAFSFPIYSEEHVGVQLACLTKLEQSLLNGGPSDEIRQAVRQTEALFLARLNSINAEPSKDNQSELKSLEAELLVLEGLRSQDAI